NAKLCKNNHLKLLRLSRKGHFPAFFACIYFLFDPPGIKNTHLISEYDMIFETKTAIFAYRQKSVCL
ncbi:hypothetical protein, partial [Bacillus haynesii]|uniref:hypothetical protein n=1 Tax=Bacillus haynesii TaxID=1925021 RepID=UPI0022802EF6